MSGESSTASAEVTAKRKKVLLIVIAVVSLGGLADAIYLTIEHITGQSVRCTIISGCSEVLSSSYAWLVDIRWRQLGHWPTLRFLVWQYWRCLVIESPGSC